MRTSVLFLIGLVLSGCTQPQNGTHAQSARVEIKCHVSYTRFTSGREYCHVNVPIGAGDWYEDVPVSVCQSLGLVAQATNGESGRP